MKASLLPLKGVDSVTRRAELAQTVLVVDDSESARRTVLEALRRHGVKARVVTAPNGSEALSMMATHDITLVLCDVEMPEMDGFRFLSIVGSKREFAAVPVIMVTVKEGLPTKLKALTEGASDYLNKPFNEQELVARVKIHLKLQRLQHELRENNAKLEEMSRTDALTGLFNRRHFMDLLASELARSVRYGPALSLLMVDVDHFKKLNDEYGHLEGDRALLTVARVMGGLLRQCDYAARYGGEEFALLLPQTDQAGAGVVAERCRQAIAEADLGLADGKRRITVSVGVASYPRPGIRKPDDLLRLADEALYDAKAAGRNCVREAKPPR
jgi:two-component system, cell cycle response regulator